MQSSRLFGYLPVRLDLQTSTFSISSLDSLDQSIAVVSKSPRLKNGWLWPPTQSGRGFEPQPRFGVPLTHELTLLNAVPSDVDALAEYLITALGFLHGIVLIPEGWGHMTRVNVDAEQMRDYLLQDSARLRVLSSAMAFWQQHPSLRHHLFGLMYWHSAASAFPRDYEQFAWHYSVLDACWLLHARLHGLPERGGHAERIKRLADAYQLKIPGPWDDGRAIVKIRNDLVHEASWGGQPIGFSPGPRIGYGANSHGGGPMHEIPLVGTLVAFTTRAILAILGESGTYVHSALQRGPCFLE